MKVKFGVCADLHSEYVHDSVQRINDFICVAQKEKVDFMVQLGDFCPPGEVNLSHKLEILKNINSCSVPFYHIFGNHDLDYNFKKDVLSFYGTDKQYYSFDCGQVHFVFLDSCCFRKDGICFDYEIGNYKKIPSEDISVISDSQLKWLESDLNDAKYPAVLFSHHSLIESRASVQNSSNVRNVLKSAPNGVVAAFCGHEHIDRVQKLGDIWYCCINGMSYYWAGSAYRHNTYGDEIEKSYPQLSKVFPYKEPLFAIVEITDKEILIKGKDTEFVGYSPREMNFVKDGLIDEITTSIKDKLLLL